MSSLQATEVPFQVLVVHCDMDLEGPKLWSATCITVHMYDFTPEAAPPAEQVVPLVELLWLSSAVRMALIGNLLIRKHSNSFCCAMRAKARRSISDENKELLIVSGSLLHLRLF